jgi:hypothetical protein
VHYTDLTGWIVYRDIACWGAVRGVAAYAYAKEILVATAELWANSVYAQTLHRNTNYILFIDAGSLS